MKRFIIASVLASGMALSSFAQAAPPARAERSVVAPSSEPRVRRVTVTINPLPALVGRYGGNVELVPWRHHALVASGFVQTFPMDLLRRALPADAELAAQPRPRVGGEIGYRFYTGSRGANGLFLGPSFVAMPIAYPRVSQDAVGELVTFHAFGAAADLGFQHITDAGFTFSAGAGVMYLSYEPPSTHEKAPKLIEPHVLPRLLVAAGWSF